jgi:23S rRNA (cytidine2498-2'-O)-methyltransferase
VGGPAVVDVLAAELKSLGAKLPPDAEVAPGVLCAFPGKGVLDPAFARQVLPAARLLRGAHLNELAAAILDVAAAQGASLVVEDAEVTLPEMPRRGSHALDEHPLTAASAELLDVLRKKIAGRREKHGGDPPSGHKLRVLLVEAWAAWVSVAKRVEGPALLAWPSSFPGGRPLDEEARDAPSSAHRKLDEALAWLERGPGEGDHVVDLGAAPGGWSWVALQKGATVEAVDRADLNDDVASHPRLTHVRADAFKHVPARRPTWLICDVIAEPERSLEVAQRAVTSSALQGLVVTLKLKRPVKLDVLAKARAFARTTPGFFGRVKNLSANKLEVSLMMKRA